MDLILFGIQGSGKGTQGKVLRERYKTEYFETGAELRRLANADSELGHKIKDIIEAGHLVPDDIIMEIVENFLNKIDKSKSVIFDGIPRSICQSKGLNEILKSRGRQFKAVVLDLSSDSAIERLTTRRICSKCKTAFPAKYENTTCSECGGELITRKDDNAESIKTRLKAYEKNTLPVIMTYDQSGQLIHIDGEQDIESVSKELIDKLDQYFK